MLVKRNLIKGLILCSIFSTSIAMASQTPAQLEELSKKAISKAESTAKEAVTQQKIIDKVREAAKLVETSGPEIFDKFRGESDFIFNGTYIWIHDIDGKMVVHPIKPKMEGNSLINLKDVTGKLFFTEMNNAVQVNASGEAWVDYMWPKPGETTPSKKVSFVKKAVYKDQTYVLGCGVYDLDLTGIKK